MLRQLKIVLFFFIVSSLAFGCAAPQDAGVTEQSGIAPLRVGVTPNYPPIIFKQGETVTGVEADLARKLAKELGRSVRFVELRWEDQIPALLSGKTDIIMSGMSITETRKVRVKFSEPYLKSGLLTMMRVEDLPLYDSIDVIMETSDSVGVVRATTGEIFVRRELPNVIRIVSLREPDDAASALRRHSIDLFIHDAPSVMWQVAENEADMVGFWEPLNTEFLGWGIRRNDQELLDKVNNALKKWNESGELNEILIKWLPSRYLHKFI